MNKTTTVLLREPFTFSSGKVVQLDEVLASDQYIFYHVIYQCINDTPLKDLLIHMALKISEANGEVRDIKALRSLFYEVMREWLEGYPGPDLIYRRSGQELAGAIRCIGERVAKGTRDLQVYFSEKSIRVSPNLRYEVGEVANEMEKTGSLENSMYLGLSIVTYILRGEGKEAKA
jgi:hypothetical protein